MISEGSQLHSLLRRNRYMRKQKWRCVAMDRCNGQYAWEVNAWGMRGHAPIMPLICCNICLPACIYSKAFRFAWPFPIFIYNSLPIWLCALCWTILFDMLSPSKAIGYLQNAVAASVQHPCHHAIPANKPFASHNLQCRGKKVHISQGKAWKGIMHGTVQQCRGTMMCKSCVHTCLSWYLVVWGWSGKSAWVEAAHRSRVERKEGRCSKGPPRKPAEWCTLPNYISSK